MRPRKFYPVYDQERCAIIGIINGYAEAYKKGTILGAFNTLIEAEEFIAWRDWRLEISTKARNAEEAERRHRLLSGGDPVSPLADCLSASPYTSAFPSRL